VLATTCVSDSIDLSVKLWEIVMVYLECWW